MVTVIIPVYNGERWLAECINTLNKQTIFDQLDIIFVDDGSTDSSGKIIDEYAGKNSNVRGIHISNHGVSYARNVGLDAAKGEYIAFLDVDDTLDDDYYDTLLSNMENDCDIVCGGYIVEYPENHCKCSPSTMSYYASSKCVEAYLSSKEMDPNIWDKLYRSSLLSDIRFNTELVQSEDRYFCFQCVKKAKKIKLIPEAKYHYRMNEASAMHSSFSRKKLDSCIVADYICNEIKKEFPQYDELAQCYAIDIKSRLVGEMYRTKAQKQYPDDYKRIYSQIRHFSFKKKLKWSNKKHIVAFLAIKMHPAIYVFLKHGMRLQYK